MKSELEQKRKEQMAGFTLIEIVLVLFLVSLVFLAIYGLFVNTLKHDTESRYEIIAANLAQEGIEIVRNIRDENIMRGVGNSAIEINDGINVTCQPQVGDDGATSCGETTNPRLALDSDGSYKPDSAGDVFYRRCTFSEVETGADGKVSSFKAACEVCWKSFVGAGEKPGVGGHCEAAAGDDNNFRSVKAEATLTDWLE